MPAELKELVCFQKANAIQENSLNKDWRKSAGFPPNDAKTETLKKYHK
jgi:hypothetical protein